MYKKIQIKGFSQVDKRLYYRRMVVLEMFSCNADSFLSQENDQLKSRCSNTTENDFMHFRFSWIYLLKPKLHACSLEWWRSLIFSKKSGFFDLMILQVLRNTANATLKIAWGTRSKIFCEHILCYVNVLRRAEYNFFVFSFLVFLDSQPQKFKSASNKWSSRAGTWIVRFIPVTIHASVLPQM